MKTINRQYIIALVLLTLFSTSCEDFLDENSVSYQTTDNYYVTEQGFEDLVRSNYTKLREIHKERDLVLLGTDLFTKQSWDEAGSGNQGSELNAYDTRFTPNVDAAANLWDLLYSQIARTNTAISRKDGVEEMDANLLAIRVGEAKFLRALSYFYAVQQWGDIPMPLEEVTTATREVTKVPAAQVYDQIIMDLEEAAAILPTKGNTDYGRATKGAAQFLLARVHLTRGWNFDNSLGGTSADFNKAVEYADLIIADYPLESNYSNLFPLHAENPLEETFPSQNDKSAEIVFAVQYSDNILTNGSDNDEPSEYQIGNDYHSIFGGETQSIPGSLGRTTHYNAYGTRFRYIVTPATYRLFDPQMDTRYHHNFLEAMYALSDVDDFVPDLDDPGTTINITTGDTVLYFPPWNNPVTNAEKGMDVGGSKPYAVLNLDEIAINPSTPYHLEDQTPLMWKFFEPGLPYDEAQGTFDLALFRSAEAYLIAAEAILKGASNGDLGGAEAYYNTIVDRALGVNAGSDPMRAQEPANLASLAEVSYRANGNLDIDMILDERARELLGEYSRWFDLKRTEKLVERTSLMNPWTAALGQLSNGHYLRPIPQKEIDRSSPSISQNDGY
ncbi:RagB/SusD family nutrient uptake outer membrane protein [Reichenbachiella carrageenanivorans]|uniref:RagB/SusD family nutrient uptake outer membrane protein n=1 Tax=Reichenbachiella carrageenanivorans TaxID=2979869 RepID=A0ABY6D0W7_9BACT|nr:RagB/SusD family nutrient uptake outer membrane protein [Reichenbachiella carrageenanivorans]UXX79816.1 RagB/SusD family nutrient uptake outer membrane protein [Reichenbachiella carrageenanivorans]